MTPIVIDTDPGHDDAIAILMALANPDQCSVQGLTTVAGNQTVEKVTANALSILALVHRGVPVAAGAAAPLRRALVTGGFAHGSTGLDGPALPAPERSVEPLPAVEFLFRLLRDAAEPVTLVALAPLTNIAQLLHAYPEIRSKIARISLMGGGINGGNMTMAAEFNFYVDPDAARIVFASGIPIVMSGLDVTEKALIHHEEVERLRARGGASRFVAELLDFYSGYSRRQGAIASPLHDPCAVAWILEPGLFAFTDYFVDIETEGEITRGMSVADRRRAPGKPPNARVLVDVNREGLMRLLFDSLARLDAEIGRGRV